MKLHYIIKVLKLVDLSSMIGTNKLNADKAFKVKTLGLSSYRVAQMEYRCFKNKYGLGQLYMQG